MKNLLKQLGLRTKEQDIFLTLLGLGAQPISIVAKRSSIPRSSMYSILERLESLELIQSFERRGVRYVQTIPIQELKIVLQRRQQRLDQTIATLKQHLPELEKIQNQFRVAPQVKLYEGVTEVERMYEQIIGQEKEFCGLFNPAALAQFSEYYLDALPKQLKKLGGKARELLIDSPEAQEYREKYHNGRHQIFLLPKTIKFQSDMIITEDKIFLVSFGDQQVAGTLLINVDLAKTQKVLFEEMWVKYAD
jgi:sugar-specific transcriptional regulator TrmB